MASTRIDNSVAPVSEPVAQHDPALTHALIDVSQDILGVLAADGTIVFESPALLKTLGFRPDELIGRNGLAMIHPDDLPGVQTMLGGLVPGGPSGDVRFWFEHKSGSYRLLDGRAALRLGSDQRPYIVFSATDITEYDEMRAAHSEMEQRFAELLDTAPDAILAITDSVIVLANRSASRLLQLPGDGHLVGARLSGLLHPEEADDVLTLLETVQAGGAMPAKELRLRTPGGDYSWSEAIASSVPLDGRPAALLIVRDTSARIRAADALEAANADLRAANFELSQMAEVAAHDLREPLRTIQGFLQLLERRNPDMDPTSKEYVDLACGGVQRLDHLLKDFSAFARVTDVNSAMRQVSTQAVMQRALGDLDKLVRAHGAMVSHGTLPTVFGDAPQLEHLFRELLGNAIKYAKPGTPPEIDVAADWRDGRWHFRVQDNGIGIPAKHQTRVFQIFRRLQAQDATPGTGMGLATARRIVEHHGGSIWVDPAHTDGTAMCFTLSASSSHATRHGLGQSRRPVD